jgi:cell division septal protein FtsQ
VSNVPGVKNAAVRRLPNGNLSIKVKLHKAVAYWTDGADIFPISGEGIIVTTPIESRPENAVVFRGKVPNDITEIAKLAGQITSHLDYLEWIENRRWNIHTRENMTIMLPENNSAAAFAALMVLDKNHGILSKKLSVLDMRDTSRILVKQ